uniref:Protocadherin 2 gamma c6 sCP1 n=1 Tax=Echinococcus granulosus TaxID=6210 RepID=A0A068WEQ7_ECHGR|nr:protocadherin 2 gamma c6 sCP1 [Echinococcus granulosus]
MVSKGIFLLITFLLLISHCPVGSQLMESVSVLENSELGTVVYDLREGLLRILDPGQLANVTVYAGQQDLFWPFALKDLRIIVARPLDREAICEKQRAFDLSQYLSGALNGGDCPIYHCCQLLHINVVVSPTSPTQVFFIRVAVQDLNDNPPTFPHLESPFATIPEDLPVGERIPLPEAIDIDSRPFGVMDYRIARWIQGNASHFQLNTMTDQEDEEVNMKTGHPYLSVVHPLDRETEEVYEFVLEAIDGGQGDGESPFTGSVGILIRVRDVNDNAPEFDEKAYSAVVQENTLPRRVLQFKVADMDAGENGRVFLSIFDPTHKANNLFRVSLQNTLPPPEALNRYSQSRRTPGSFYTASVHLLEYPDAEQLPPRLKFHITATDNGQPPLSSRAEVNVDIINVNDQAPNIVFLREGKRLTSSRLALPEVITVPESIVVEVHVTDSDSNLGQLSCSVTSEMDAFRLIEVHPFSNGGDSAATVLSNFRHSIPSSSTFSSSSSFLFPSYRQFTLRTKVNLDRETKAAYMVTLMCTDNDSAKPLTRNASLHVSISDINDETPRFEHTAYQGHVRENQANAPVTHLSPSPTLCVTDADIGRNALITFSLKEAPEKAGKGHPLNASTRDTSDVGYFRIDPRSGRLWTVTALDAEEDAPGEHKYVFYVVATDDGVPERRSSSALVTVLVDDVNDNPPTFEHYTYNFEVEENAPVGTVVGQVSVRDADLTETNRRVRFLLRGRPEDLFLVDIDRATGQLSMRRPVDFEKQSSISLTVIAENEAPLATSPVVDSPMSSAAYHTEANVIISVLNLNDNRPEFVLITPHRKHIIFAWEQLPPAGVNQTLRDQRRFCEPIPYRVIDRDCDPTSRVLCCTLELDNTFDGMFGLFGEIPNVLCALKRPPQPQSYKLLLKARDGTGNDSLSSQIQLSVIVKSEPDYTKFIQKDPSVASPLDSGIDAVGGSSGAQEGERAGEGRPRGPGQVRRQWMHLEVQDSEKEEEKLADAIPPPASLASPSSSQQMKIISVLVSIAGIFCILLLFIIAALKCGLLDSQYFASNKTPENARTMTEGEGLVTIAQKHEVLTMGPSSRAWNEEYRALNESYPKSVFCVDHKISAGEGAKKHNGREGAYDISIPFNASSISTNNNGSSYPGNVTSGPCILGSYQTIPSSPKLMQQRKLMTKPLTLSTIRFSDHMSLEVANRMPPKPTAYLAPDGRLIPIEGAEFYGFSDAYQTLDPSTFSKSSKNSKESPGPAEGSKVTFNLETLPISQAGEMMGGVERFERLLKNDILGEKGDDKTSEDPEKPIDDIRHDLVIYKKSTKHSSFV